VLQCVAVWCSVKTPKPILCFQHVGCGAKKWCQKGKKETKSSGTHSMRQVNPRDTSTVLAEITLQHAATHCNALHRTATHCNTCCNTLQHTTHAASHCNTPGHDNPWESCSTARGPAHCNRLQRTATHCNTLQNTATYCITVRYTWT